MFIVGMWHKRHKLAVSWKIKQMYEGSPILREMNGITPGTDTLSYLLILVTFLFILL